MVSRLLAAGRNLAVLSLLLSLLAMLAFAPSAMARNENVLRDGHEGDPGDGVLNPAPVVDPEPNPAVKLFPVFIIMMVPQDDNSFLPVFQLTGFTGSPRVNYPQARMFAVQEGRWHNAP